MTHPLNITPLLSALSEAGLHIDVTELTRLHHVFTLQPALANGDDTTATRRRLKAVLRAVMVKRAADGTAFDTIYDNWFAQAEQEMQIRAAPAPTKLVTEPAANKTPRSSRPAWRRYRGHGWAAAIVLLVVVVFAAYQQLRPPVFYPPDPIVTPPPPFKPDETAPGDFPDPRARSFTHYIPQFQVRVADPVRSLWGLGLSALALLVAAAVWRQLSQNRWLPEPAPPPDRPGPPRVFLRPPALQGPQLIERRQQETLVWGINRFLADEPSRRLDLCATVDATARAGGIPHLHFEPATYQREVWLWVDEAAEDPTMMRLVDEIITLLNAYGLTVAYATFRGIPEPLVTATGEVFAPREVDERRDTALVAILTDGRLLARQYAADDRRVQIDALLRGLSHWPHLVFVDFSAVNSPLRGIVTPHSLACIAPAALATFLGGSTEPIPENASPHHEAVWAAACALAPTSVDEATALALRQTLTLRTSPWALRRLHAAASGSATRLHWPPARRADQLNWLRDAEAGDGRHDVVPGGWLDRALSFWEAQYERELGERTRQGAIASWAGTPAEQYLRMELHLLRL